MNIKIVKFALTAAAVVGTTAAMAQEMGDVAEEPSEIQAETEAIEAEPVPEAADAPLTMDELVPHDEGVEIVEEAQKTAPAEVAVAMDASSAMLEWLKANNYEQGFNDERGYFLQVGVARDNSLDPIDEDFMTKREMLYREAQLRAKIDISGRVEREVSAKNWKTGLNTDDIKRFEAKFSNEINEMNEKKRRVAKLMLAMEMAEADCLKGVTTTDRLNMLVDKVIKKLDKSYEDGKILEAKKARYEELKKAYDLAKDAAEELENKKIDMFPSQTMNAKIDSCVVIRLHGAIPLHQIESYVGNEFQVAVAVIWSPKLEDRAARMLARKEIAKGNPTENRTLTEYLDANKGSLPAMVGARQYLDKNGKLYFIGISAQEVPEDAVEKDDAIVFADQMAMQAVVMSLYVEGKGVTSAQAALAKRKGRSGEAVKALAENMEESTPKDLVVSGLGKVYSTEGVYPITDKRIYISVAAIDSTLAAKSPEIKKAWEVRANDTVRTLHEIAGERQGAEDAYEASKNSTKEFEAGRRKSRAEIEKAVEDIRKPKTDAKVVPVKKVPAQTSGQKKAKQGVLGGSASHSDDF